MNHKNMNKSNVQLEGNKVLQGTIKMHWIIWLHRLWSKPFEEKILGFIPDGMVYSLEDVFNKIIKENSMLAFKAKERFYEIGSLKGLKEFTDFIIKMSISGGVER